MIRKALVMLSLCCIVLCAIIGVLSHNEMQKSDKRIEVAQTESCASILGEPPVATKTIAVSKFVPGKFIADFDFDADGNWDVLCVPLFPNKNIDVSRHYRAVLVRFKGIKNQDELDAVLSGETLEATFWPERQDLDEAVHSSLAQQYMRLDFKHSPVLLYGFEKSNPVLGQATLQLSKFGGGGAGCLFLLSLVSLLFKRKKQSDEPIDPRRNMAGLPSNSKLTTSKLFN